MNVQLFCPLPIERPKAFANRADTFGQGPKAGIALAKRLNLMAFDYAIVFGCAGSLKEDYRPGDVYLIDQLKEGADQLFIETPPVLSDMPRASLTSVSEIAATPEVKQELAQTHGADLVDMEMTQIWTHLNPEVQKKVIFLRGPVDSVHDSLEFLSNPKMMFRWDTIKQLIKLTKNMKAYSRAMTETLSSVLHHLRSA